MSRYISTLDARLQAVAEAARDDDVGARYYCTHCGHHAIVHERDACTSCDCSHFGFIPQLIRVSKGRLVPTTPMPPEDAT